MAPVGVFGMVKAELRVGSRRDPHAERRQIARLAGLNAEAQSLGIDHDKAVAAKSGIDAQGAQPFDFQGRVQVAGKRGQVAHRDGFGLAVLTVRTHAHQAARRLQGQLGDWLLHGDQASIQQHGRNADRVRARHGRRVLGLHDDKGRVGLGVLGRHQQIDVTKDPAARLVQHEAAQTLILSDVATLRPEAVARRSCDAPGDDIAHLAFGVARDVVDDLGAAHVRRPSAIATHHRWLRGCCVPTRHRRCGKAGSCPQGCAPAFADGPRSAPHSPPHRRCSTGA